MFRHCSLSTLLCHMKGVVGLFEPELPTIMLCSMVAGLFPASGSSLGGVAIATASASCVVFVQGDCLPLGLLVDCGGRGCGRQLLDDTLPT